MPVPYYTGVKKCSTCGIEKEDDEFHRKGSGLQSMCKACKRAHHKQYYKKNRARFRESIASRRARVREAIAEYKRRPCADCKQSFHPCVMDFDHVDGEKVQAVSKCGTDGWSWERVMSEIEKCEVVCANCHRMRTHNRLTRGE